MANQKVSSLHGFKILLFWCCVTSYIANVASLLSCYSFRFLACLISVSVILKHLLPAPPHPSVLPHPPPPPHLAEYCHLPTRPLWRLFPSGYGRCEIVAPPPQPGASREEGNPPPVASCPVAHHAAGYPIDMEAMNAYWKISFAKQWIFPVFFFLNYKIASVGRRSSWKERTCKIW